MLLSGSSVPKLGFSISKADSALYTVCIQLPVESQVNLCLWDGSPDHLISLWNPLFALLFQL